MKKLLVIFLLGALPAALFGQKNPDWRKTGDHWARKNSITLSSYTLTQTSYNGGGFSFGIEYDRAIVHNLSVSAIALCAPSQWSWATDSYTIHENFYFAGVKANYNLPVVRNWLYFRIGMGGGIGYHDLRSRSFGMIDCREGECPTMPPLENVVKPHFMADMYWVLRAAKWLELRFAPLIVSPSQIIVGSKYDAPYYNSTFFYFNMFGALGISVRF